MGVEVGGGGSCLHDQHAKRTQVQAHTGINIRLKGFLVYMSLHEAGEGLNITTTVQREVALA